MTRARRTLLAAAGVWFTAAASFLVAAGPLGAQAVDPPLAVTGSLVDESGAAVGGVEVVLRPYPSAYDLDLSLLAEAETLPEPAERTVSGPDGTFVVSATHAGPYRLEIHSTPPEDQGAVAVPLVYLDLAPLKLPRHLEPIELPDRRPLTVRVSGPDGQPLEDAVVLVDFTAGQERRDSSSRQAYVDEQPQRLYPQLDRASVRTDAEGVARFLAPAAEAHVVVSAPGLPVRSAATDSGRVAIQLDAEPAVTVRVRAPDGSPARGTVVRSGTASRLPLALTDDQGEATIRLEPRGRQTFELEAADGAFASAMASPMAANRTPREDAAAAPRILEMQLRPPSNISGRVAHAATAHAVPGAAVWVRSDPGRAALADQLGGFDLIAPFRQDQLDLGVAAAGFLSATAKVSLQAGSEQAIGLTASVPLAGWITDDSGRPVGGANVWAEPNVPWTEALDVGGSARATSGADGSFWIEDAVYSQPYELTVTAEGFAPTAFELAPFEPGTAANPARVVLTRGRQAWGTVAGPEGAAVAGAKATLFWPQDASEPGLLGREEAVEPVVSNARGEFEFSGVAPGPYTIDVTHPEHVDVQGKTIHVPHGSGYADLGVFTLVPGLEIHGVVADANGRRIEGAEVQSVQRTRSFAASQTRTAVTSEDGTFRLSGQLPVLADLSATADGYAPSVVRSVRPPTSEPVLIELGEGASLAGRVLAPEGRPAADVDVRLTPALREMSRVARGLGPEHLFHRARSDGDGRFRFDSLVPAVWSVEASDETGRSARDRVDLGQGELREISLELTMPDRLMVSVTNHIGEPVARAEVAVKSVAPSQNRDDLLASLGERSYGRTDATGQVSLSITAGEASVEVEHPDLLAQTRKVVLNPGDNELHFQLDRGWEISGMVRSTGGGVVPGATVEAEQADAGGIAWEEQPVEMRGVRRLLVPPTRAVSAADGSFRLVGLDRGRYSLAARLPGYSETQSADTVEIDGQSVAGVQIVLSPGASIQGVVTGLGPAEMATAGVFASGGVLSRDTIPDREGRFELEALAPGPWQLVALAGDRKTREQAVTLEPGATHPPVELRFEQGFRLTGQILVAGQPASGGFVSAALPDQKDPRRTRTDHEGRFEIRGLPAGSYQLKLRHERGVGVTQTLDVQGDHDGLLVNLEPRPAQPN